ncbi:unnamed protein product [Trichobilharzia regenti]|nr:unnamed protein product [Trichobilharzia regenti]
MTSLKRFVLGFQEFLTTPSRLWRMHYHLTQFTSSQIHNTKIHEHQRERQKRLQIRIPSTDRLVTMASQSDQSTSSGDKLSESSTEASASRPHVLAVLSYFFSLIPLSPSLGE